MKSAINLLCRAAWNIVKPCSFFESIRSPNLLFLLRVLPTARLRLRFTLWRRFFLWRYIRWGRTVGGGIAATSEEEAVVPGLVGLTATDVRGSATDFEVAIS